jgi:hypothetical protein
MTGQEAKPSIGGTDSPPTLLALLRDRLADDASLLECIPVQQICMVPQLKAEWNQSLQHIELGTAPGADDGYNCVGTVVLASTSEGWISYDDLFEIR